jgi:hypothetical protein
MNVYQVVWEMDIEADSPQEAAALAREAQTRAGTEATVFQVYPQHKWVELPQTGVTQVDLTYGDRDATA